MRWKVGIEGPPGIIHPLAIAVSDHDMRLVAGQNVVILCGSRLDLLDDVCSVRRQAQRIVTILSGSARLLFGSTESLQVTDVTDARADVYTDAVIELPPCEARHRSRRGARTATDRPCDRNAWSDSLLFKLLRVTLSDPAMEEALRLRDAIDLDWAELVRIYEIIEEAVGGWRAVAGFPCATPTKIQQLFHTTNWAAAAGASVRYGLEDIQPSAGDMTLSEARCLVDHLLLTWLGAATLQTR